MEPNDLRCFSDVARSSRLGSSLPCVNQILTFILLLHFYFHTITDVCYCCWSVPFVPMCTCPYAGLCVFFCVAVRAQESGLWAVATVAVSYSWQCSLQISELIRPECKPLSPQYGLMNPCMCWVCWKFDSSACAVCEWQQSCMGAFFWFNSSVSITSIVYLQSLTIHNKIENGTGLSCHSTCQICTHKGKLRDFCLIPPT